MTTANTDKDEVVCHLEFDLTQDEIFMLGQMFGTAMKYRESEDLNLKTISSLFGKFGTSLASASPWREPSK